MPRVFVHGRLTATWPGGVEQQELNSAHGVARAGLLLLIAEMGEGRARKWIERELRSIAVQRI